MTLSRASFSPEQSDQMNGKLQAIPEALHALGAGNGKGVVPSELLVLAEALFNRAPEDFLRRTSITTLAQITTEVAAFLKKYLAGNAPFLVEWQNHLREPERQRYSSLFVALSDRPFIVDSVSEFLRAQGIRHHVLLHPVLKEEDQLVSIIYVEIDRLEDGEHVQQIKEELARVLHDLLLVTDHFAPMVSAVERAAQDLRDEADREGLRDANAQEICDLLSWLCNGNFIFTGYREWAVKDDTVVSASDTDQGLFLSANHAVRGALEAASQDARYLRDSGERILVLKSSVECPVHRRTKMDTITVRSMPRKGSERIFTIAGLFTSQTIGQSAAQIPLLRRKLKAVLDAEGFVPNSYNYKETISFINSLPKSLLFQLDIPAIRNDLHIMMGMQRRNEARVIFHADPLQRFITVFVVIPRERFSSKMMRSIRTHLETKFHLVPNSLDYQLSIVEELLATIAFLVPTPSEQAHFFDRKELEETITVLTQSWGDKLFQLFAAAYGKPAAHRLMGIYEHGFPTEYLAAATPEEAFEDIRVIEGLSPAHPLDITISPIVVGGDRPQYDLRIYKRGQGLTLSAIAPFIENIGLELFAEKLVVVSSNQEPWAAIHSLYVAPRSGGTLRTGTNAASLLDGINAVFRHEAENDRFNALLVTPALSLKEVALVRTVARYLWQIRAFPSENVILAGLVENPSVTKLLVEYFNTRFDPALGQADSPERVARMKQLRDEFNVALKSISLLAHDRVLRAAWNAIESTVRTNYFSGPSLKIALKIDCHAILRMPNPRPLFEIFVTAPTFEGVHLRGGRVARGGLRWSERPDDFRTEVLGLMKTQMVKNSIIVPVGAKGGFVLKPLASEGHATLRDAVVQNYREFIRSLLEVSDNRKESAIVRPANVVCHDPEDPYLVVAADKGTADLSDVANEIAVKEFQFWLGDAFASGGSQGFSHKKYGITARGAWETTCRHFRELGIDPEKDEFTVTGIGDMSGDVFGNGLILSDKAKLIGAFDHREIFLDPNPDPKRSFAERKRLFELPRSKWSDYSKDLISTGGGVYPRDEKEIVLGPEIADRLGIEPGTYAGQEVIRAILKAPVDLIWNGGIGTYVKASFEENMNVPDRGNDDVRIDATEMRAKIFTEGGNLGATQLGRIEYAQRGGYINTDAVDNSGGVNLSDLEVNLKILFAQLVARNEMTIEERNALLVEYANDVCDRVLIRNRSQALVISLDLIRSKIRLATFQRFIHFLETKQKLNRRGEFLPDDDALSRRAAAKAGLTRPELAVLVAYAKMWVFETLLHSKRIEDPSLNTFLLRYFPQRVSQRFEKDIINHPLRKEIIATQVANVLVERMGAAWVYRTTSETDADPIDVISSWIVAEDVLGGWQLNRDLFAVDKPGMQHQYHASLLKLAGSIDRMVHWLLERRNPNMPLSQLVQRYAAPVQELGAATEEILPPRDLTPFHESWTSLAASGFTEELAKRVSATVYGASYLETADLSLSAKLPLRDVAQLYADLAATLQISNLLQFANRIEVNDQWEQLAVRALLSELRSTLGVVTRAVIEEFGNASRESLESYLARRRALIEGFQLNVQALSNRPLNIAALFVLSRQLLALRRPVAE